MSGPVSPPLATTESGTTVRVQPTNTLEFNGADFTVTQSGSKASIAIDSTGTGAALTDTHIGFGSAANLLTGSANFTFTEETGGNGPTVLLTGDKPVLQMRDDTAATLYRTEFVQSGASMFIFHRDSTGTDKELLRLSNSYIRINDDGLDIDVKMEGENVDHLFSLDAAQDNIGIGDAPASGGGRFQVFSTTVADETVRIVVNSTVAEEGSHGPYLDLVRGYSDGVGQDGAQLGIFRFRGENDAGSQITFADINVATYDVSAGSEDGVMRFHVETQGSRLEYMRITARDAGSPEQKAVVINEASSDIGFRVESDGVNPALMVNSGTDNVGVGCDPDSSVQLEVKNAVAPGSASIVRLSNSNTSMPNDTKFGAIEFYNADASGAGVGAEIRALSNGSGRGGQLDFLVSSSGGSQTSKMFIDESGVVTIASTASSNAVAPTQDPPLLIPSHSGPASYRYIIPSTTSPMTLTNNDLQSPLLVHASATALTINLPLDGGVKGQYFQFVSTGGDITLVPSAVAGDTINGGTASLTRSTNNEIYDCVCIASNTWILSNPA